MEDVKVSDNFGEIFWSLSFGIAFAVVCVVHKVSILKLAILNSVLYIPFCNTPGGYFMPIGGSGSLSEFEACFAFLQA